MAPNVYGILVLLGENIKMEIIWIFLGIFNWKKANLAILKKIQMAPNVGSLSRPTM